MAAIFAVKLLHSCTNVPLAHCLHAADQTHTGADRIRALLLPRRWREGEAEEEMEGEEEEEEGGELMIPGLGGMNVGDEATRQALMKMLQQQGAGGLMQMLQQGGAR